MAKLAALATPGTPQGHCPASRQRCALYPWRRRSRRMSPAAGAEVPAPAGCAVTAADYSMSAVAPPFQITSNHSKKYKKN